MIRILRSRIVAKATVVAAATFGVGTVGMPAAHATSDSITGGCFATTNENSVLTNGQNQGEIAIAAVTRDASGLERATVSCWIDVNGIEQPGTRLSTAGSGVEVAQQAITYSAVDGDTVELCQDVFFWNDGLDTGPICQLTANQIVIPGPSVGPINQIFPTTIDPLLCSVFESLAGNYGLVTIGLDGDVWVDDPLGLFSSSPIYDCPPY